MPSIDYYSEARDIAADLVKIGHNKEASELLDAIDTGSTSAEILMALRYHLMSLLNDQNLPSELIMKANTLFGFIDSVLR